MMVKANLKKTIEKIRRGEYPTRDYPNKQKANIIAKNHEELKEKFKVVDIDNIVDGKLKYYQLKPFDDKEKNIWIPKIKEYLILENLDYKEEEKPKIIEPENKLKKTDDLRIILGETYEKIIQVLKQYLDLKEEYYEIVAIWIIGTYIYDVFDTYPYLFINAMRGSGKTRLLKLIKALAHNGELVTSIREAVLFRTAKGKTLCIDEFEGLNKKENAPLRELLNACYKKGMKVQRMKKVKEEQVVEEFEPYTPIAIANIYGMEEVLGDRCINIVIDKSFDVLRTKLMERFDDDLNIKQIKFNFTAILVYMCSYFSENNHILEWNSYINNRYNNNTYNTLTTYNTYNYKGNTIEDVSVVSVFNKMDETGINGRHLELIFPLLIIANFIGEEVFDKILKISCNLIKSKRVEEVTESRDISLIEYVTTMGDDYILIKDLTKTFRCYVGDLDKDDEKWLNPKWLGRALKRLDLIKEKRRVGGGIEVVLNVQKAKDMIEKFK